MRTVEKFPFNVAGSLHSKCVPINFSVFYILRYSKLIFNSVSLSSLDEIRQHNKRKTIQGRNNVIKGLEKKACNNQRKAKEIEWSRAKDPLIKVSKYMK